MVPSHNQAVSERTQPMGRAKAFTVVGDFAIAAVKFLLPLVIVMQRRIVIKIHKFESKIMCFGLWKALLNLWESVGRWGHDSVQEGSSGDCFVRWTRSK